MVAAKPPLGEVPAPGRPSPPEAAPGTPQEGPFGDTSRFSLLRPKIEVPPLPEAPSGRGGTRRDGEGAGERGWQPDGQAAIPLDTADPRYTEYFVELKKRIEANWVYPQEAARKGQSGHGLVGFVLRRDGSLREVEIVQSSGVTLLDRYLVNAIRLAAPFPPVPDRLGRDSLPVAMTFRYILDGGFRLFSLQ
jgi:protein TonB